MYWKDLTREERQHIAPVTTLRAFKDARKQQRNMYGGGEACKECRHIGYKLGIEPDTGVLGTIRQMQEADDKRIAEARALV